MSYYESNESRKNRASTGRTHQKARTRRAILQGAERLLSRGLRPSLDEVALESEVSRATVYRYFSNIDMLLAEAPLDRKALEPQEIFARMPAKERDSAVARAVAVQHYLFDLVAQNESYFRIYLQATMAQWLEAGGKPAEPLRGARRLPMMRAALAPVRELLDDNTREKLEYALSLLVSVEAFIASTDVCGLSPRKGKAIAAWAVRTLVESVLAPKPAQHEEPR